MKKSKLRKRLVSIAAAGAMVAAMSMSVFGGAFTDVYLPQWRNPSILDSLTLGFNTSYGVVNFSMRSANSTIYCGISDRQTNAKLGEVYVDTNNKSYHIDYPTEVARGRTLQCYAGNDYAGLYQYVSGQVYF